MTEPLARPGRKNPLKRTQAPVALPSARSRAALGLAVGAAEGGFRLQVCAECDTVQYPPRDVCGACLSGDLPWQAVAPGGRLVAETTSRVAGERYFRERQPWRTGLVASDAGPSIVAHLHGDCVVEGRVRLGLVLDHAGRGAVFASPEIAAPHQEDDPQMRSFTADPKFRRVLIVDGRAATGPALAAALAGAGADKIFVGIADRWKPFGEAAYAAIPAVEIVALDVTDSASVTECAGRIGDKVDILINNAGHVRPGGTLGGQDPVLGRETFDINCLGLMRLASAFGPVMRARAADGVRSAVAFVNILSIWALAAPAAYGTYAASQAAARSLAATLRQEMREAGIRVVDVLTGPLDDDWHQVLPPPKVGPTALANAVVAALKEGREEVVVGDVAKEIHAKWAADPRLVAREDL